MIIDFNAFLRLVVNYCHNMMLKPIQINQKKLIQAELNMKSRLYNN